MANDFARTGNAAIDLLTAIGQEVAQRQEPVVMATVVRDVGSNPQKVGARLVLFPNGDLRGTVGGGRIESHIIRDAQELLQSQEPPQLKTYNLQEIGMTCGGLMDVFLERIDLAPHAVIFGGGHIAAPTAALAASVGFRVTVIDERTEWANPERFPNAELVNQPFPDFLETFVPQAHHYLILVSQGHAHDHGILRKVLDGNQAFTGMIGSKQKAWSMWKKLRKEGISEELWKRVHCPVGIPLGESQPSEIAVSIVAQLIQVRYARKTQATPITNVKQSA